MNFVKNTSDSAMIFVGSVKGQVVLSVFRVQITLGEDSMVNDNAPKDT